MNKRLFIVFEGVDGCGKSTQLRLYAGYLERRGANFVETKEPYGTTGALIREALSGRHTLFDDPQDMARLFAASRADHVRWVILPALGDGRAVLCDRYYPSSLAYQGEGTEPLGGRAGYILRLNHGIPVPTVTIVFDVSAETAIQRIVSRSGAADRFDADGEQAVRARVATYQRLAEFPGVGPVICVDGSGSLVEVQNRVRSILEPIVFGGTGEG